MSFTPRKRSVTCHERRSTPNSVPGGMPLVREDEAEEAAVVDDVGVSDAQKRQPVWL
jgi:hypothetical protein